MDRITAIESNGRTVKQCLDDENLFCTAVRYDVVRQIEYHLPLGK
jgi:hypothetical protein